jgi:hypothetical protein
MVIKQMIDIALRAGEEIVDAYDIPTNWQAIAHRDANRESQPPVTNTRVSSACANNSFEYGTMIGFKRSITALRAISEMQMQHRVVFDLGSHQSRLALPPGYNGFLSCTRSSVFKRACPQYAVRALITSAPLKTHVCAPPERVGSNSRVH